MYGKAYESMYEGSMIGAGLNVFAVWNYIIAKTRMGIIEVNPSLLAFRLGGTEDEVVAALEYLQRPDPKSRTKVEDGRRIIREGQYQFRVVNWESYQRIKNEEDRREYNRVKQAEYRARLGPKRPKTTGGGSLRGEAANDKLLANGASNDQLDANITQSLPEQCR